MNRQQVLDLLDTARGSRSLTKFANEELKCSAAYLSMVYSGVKEPGPVVLDYLGLEREIVVNYKPKQSTRRWR